MNDLVKFSHIIVKEFSYVTGRLEVIIKIAFRYHIEFYVLQQLYTTITTSLWGIKKKKIRYIEVKYKSLFKHHILNIFLKILFQIVVLGIHTSHLDLERIPYPLRIQLNNLMTVHPLFDFKFDCSQGYVIIIDHIESYFLLYKLYIFSHWDFFNFILQSS